MELSTAEIMELKSWLDSIEANIENSQAQLGMALFYTAKINKKLGYETATEEKT